MAPTIPQSTNRPAPAPAGAPPSPDAPVNFVDTPEFKAAVAAAAKEAVAPMLAQLAAATPSGNNGSIESILTGLAAKIAEVSDLNSPSWTPVRLSPEVAERQRKAREELMEVLTEVSQKKLAPRYKVCAKIFFAEQLIEPFQQGSDKQMHPTYITWQGEPNDALEPADELAERIFLLFKDTRAGVPTDRHGSGTLVAAAKKYWVSNGLVIEGAGPSADRGFRAEYTPQSELARNTTIDPNAPQVSILGTVAPAAQQSFSGSLIVPPVR